MGRFDFTSPGAAAGEAIRQFLIDAETRRRQQMLDELTATRQADDAQMQRDDLALRQQQEGRIAANEAATRQQTDAINAQKLADLQRTAFSESHNVGDEISDDDARKYPGLVTPGMVQQGAYLGDDDQGVPQYETRQGRAIYRGTTDQQIKHQREQALGELLADPTLTDDQRQAVKYAQATGDHAGIAALFKPAETEDVYRQNTRTGQIERVGAVPKGAHFMTEPAPKDTGYQDATRLDRSFQYNSTQIDKARAPIAQAVDRMARLQQTLAQNSPQADSLVAPELLTVMAGGMGTGLRMTEAEIARVVGGRTAWENLKAKIGAYQLDPSKGFALTPEQRRQVNTLVGEVARRNQSKLDALDEAGDQLVAADSVDQHRRIVATVRKKLTTIDSGTGNTSGSGSVRRYNPATGKLE